MDYTITPQYHDKKGCYIYIILPDFQTGTQMAA